MSTITLDAPPPIETQVGGVDHFSSTAERERQVALQPDERTLPLGPIKVVHAFWLAGMSCDGCSIAAVGATSPSVEDLIAGTIPGVPRVVLHHCVLSVESGEEFIRNYKMAEKDELGAPYVVIYEGSIADERIAAATGGYFSAMGAEKKADGAIRPIPSSEWLKRLAPGAAAVIAIGTCATWGGVPAAVGNPTGSMSVMDFLGKDYRSSYGLPVINVPGCSPVGDNFTETIACTLLFLQGHGPLPEFDELGRPQWLFNETCRDFRIVFRPSIRSPRGQTFRARAQKFSVPSCARCVAFHKVISIRKRVGFGKGTCRADGGMSRSLAPS